MELNIKGGSEKNPERAILSSTIIGYISRDVSVKLDRLLKSNYEENKRNPLILDAKFRIMCLSYFSDNGANILPELIKYFSEKELYSAHLEIKNLLVVASKEGIVQEESPFGNKELVIAKGLVNNGKAEIISRHVKFAVSCCILLGRLGENFEKFMNGENMIFKHAPEVAEVAKEACLNLQKEIKQKIDNSKLQE